MRINWLLPWIFALVLGVCGAWSCTNPTGLGLDLLEEDVLNLLYSDTLSVETGTAPGDSTVVHTPANFAGAYLLGRLNDPVFGISEAGLYAQFVPEFLRPAFPASSRVDSVILVLPYDTSKFYGDLDQNLSLEVYRLQERINGDVVQYSNASFAYDPVLIGRFRGKPTKDSIAVKDYRGGTETTVTFPHLRISLSGALGQQLISADTSVYTADSLFLNFFKGLYVRPAGTGGGSLAGINLSSANAGLMVYYRTDTLARQFQFQFNRFLANVTTFKHDYTGTQVERSVAPPSAQNPYIFVQGMAGVYGRIRIPGVRKFQGVVINKAELIFQVAQLPGDDLSRYPPAGFLSLFYRDKSGVLFPIPDGLLIQSNLRDNFGGVYAPGTDGAPGLYRINLGAHFRDMVEGRVPDELFIGLSPKAVNGARSVLHGSTSPEKKVKLRIAYTPLNK
ncbi:MAG: hypothetical protein RL386_1311 [Bacteroidota bacterium]|jgi:hypothetical protein